MSSLFVQSGCNYCNVLSCSLLLTVITWTATMSTLGGGCLEGIELKALAEGTQTKEKMSGHHW